MEWEIDLHVPAGPLSTPLSALGRWVAARLYGTIMGAGKRNFER
ncbi:hypothetical protein [Corynebacterium oculi]|nr:hypothetical protein [Corynebacterium oculi]